MRRTKFPPSVRLKGMQGWYFAIEVLPGKFMIQSNRVKKKQALKVKPSINYCLIKITKDYQVIERYKYRYNGWEVRGRIIKLLK